MKTFEAWILWVADSDWCWTGFNWMRPKKETHIGFAYMLFSSFILGLPGLMVGMTAICLLHGWPGWEVFLGMLALVMMVEFFLHLVFAHFWNRRAAELRAKATG